MLFLPNSVFLKVVTLIALIHEVSLLRWDHVNQKVQSRFYKALKGVIKEFHRWDHIKRKKIRKDDTNLHSDKKSKAYYYNQFSISLNFKTAINCY